jgi:hypothetical protein
VAWLRGPQRVPDRLELVAELRELDCEPLLLVIDAFGGGGQIALALEQGAAISEGQQVACCGRWHGTLPDSQMIGGSARSKSGAGV